MSDYISVTDNDCDEVIEIPIEFDGVILHSTLAAQYPGVTGLKYKNETTSTWRGIRLEDGKLWPPDLRNWGNRLYYAVFPKDMKKKSNALEKLILEESKKSCDLIILGLPWSADETKLNEYFSQYGELVFAQIKRDINGKSKGFGFIRFAEHEAQVICLGQKHIIDGRSCEVRIPHSKIVSQPQGNSKIHVGRVTEDITSEDLTTYFSKYGKVLEVFVPKPCRGFAFVTFADPDVAQKLIGEDLIIKNTSVKISSANAQPWETGYRPSPTSNFGVSSNSNSPSHALIGNTFGNLLMHSGISILGSAHQSHGSHQNSSIPMHHQSLHPQINPLLHSGTPFFPNSPLSNMSGMRSPHLPSSPFLYPPPIHNLPHPATLQHQSNNHSILGSCGSSSQLANQVSACSSLTNAGLSSYPTTVACSTIGYNTGADNCHHHQHHHPPPLPPPFPLPPNFNHVPLWHAQMNPSGLYTNSALTASYKHQQQIQHQQQMLIAAIAQHHQQHQQHQNSAVISHNESYSSCSLLANQYHSVTQSCVSLVTTNALTTCSMGNISNMLSSMCLGGITNLVSNNPSHHQQNSAIAALGTINPAYLHQVLLHQLEHTQSIQHHQQSTLFHQQQQHNHHLLTNSNFQPSLQSLHQTMPTTNSSSNHYVGNSFISSLSHQENMSLLPNILNQEESQCQEAATSALVPFQLLHNNIYLNQPSISTIKGYRQETQNLAPSHIKPHLAFLTHPLFGSHPPIHHDLIHPLPLLTPHPPQLYHHFSNLNSQKISHSHVYSSNPSLLNANINHISSNTQLHSAEQVTNYTSSTQQPYPFLNVPSNSLNDITNGLLDLDGFAASTLVMENQALYSLFGGMLLDHIHNSSGYGNHLNQNGISELKNKEASLDLVNSLQMVENLVYHEKGLSLFTNAPGYHNNILLNTNKNTDDNSVQLEHEHTNYYDHLNVEDNLIKPNSCEYNEYNTDKCPTADIGTLGSQNNEKRLKVLENGCGGGGGDIHEQLYSPFTMRNKSVVFNLPENPVIQDSEFGVIGQMTEHLHDKQTHSESNYHSQLAGSSKRSASAVYAPCPAPKKNFFFGDDDYFPTISQSTPHGLAPIPSSAWSDHPVYANENHAYFLNSSKPSTPKNSATCFTDDPRPYVNLLCGNALGLTANANTSSRLSLINRYNNYEVGMGDARAASITRQDSVLARHPKTRLSSSSTSSRNELATDHARNNHYQCHYPPTPRSNNPDYHVDEEDDDDDYILHEAITRSISSSLPLYEEDEEDEVVADSQDRHDPTQQLLNKSKNNLPSFDTKYFCCDQRNNLINNDSTIMDQNTQQNYLLTPHDATD